MGKYGGEMEREVQESLAFNNIKNIGGKSMKEIKGNSHEYKRYRCCMCPNGGDPEKLICPEGPFKTGVTQCRFVKQYIDSRGWKYKVMGGIGESSFKARYKKPETKSWKCMKNLEWRTCFDEAQKDLNQLAELKSWVEVND